MKDTTKNYESYWRLVRYHEDNNNVKIKRYSNSIMIEIHNVTNHQKQKGHNGNGINLLYKIVRVICSRHQREENKMTNFINHILSLSDKILQFFERMFSIIRTVQKQKLKNHK